MDRILSYLPEKVHVRFGWENEPRYYGDIPDKEYSTICIPKEWLKHGKRGHWYEWTIKKTYQKKLANEFGEKYLHSTEQLQIREWNQLENVSIMYQNALRIGFDNILEIAKTMNSEDAKYTHAIGY